MVIPAVNMVIFLGEHRSRQLAAHLGLVSGILTGNDVTC